MNVFAIRGTTILLCHTFRKATKVATDPVTPGIRIFYYVAGVATDLVSLVAMTRDSGVTGQHSYSWTVPSTLAPHTTCYVRFTGVAVGTGEVLDKDATVTVLDVGGFGGGLRTSFVG